jgi:hypothetical protein
LALGVHREANPGLVVKFGDTIYRRESQVQYNVSRESGAWKRRSFQQKGVNPGIIRLKSTQELANVEIKDE